MNTPQIKICGLTRPEEAEFLNQEQADYAGFVFFEKSRRNVTFETATAIRQKLDRRIKTVAVTVSPDITLLEQIEQEGFDILQVHGELRQEILEKADIPIWRACNLKTPEDIKKLEQHEKITGYVIDAGTYGSGKTFDWNRNKAVLEETKQTVFARKQFILAGGLHPGNVAEGIRIFSPDVADVSSGVEKAEGGKDKARIAEFIRNVRRASRTGTTSGK